MPWTPGQLSCFTWDPALWNQVTLRSHRVSCKLCTTTCGLIQNRSTIQGKSWGISSALLEADWPCDLLEREQKDAPFWRQRKCLCLKGVFQVLPGLSWPVAADTPPRRAWLGDRRYTGCCSCSQRFLRGIKSVGRKGGSWKPRKLVKDITHFEILWNSLFGV